jgi:hypothetical protein
VRIYAGSDCAGEPVATGAATELASPGLTVKVESGSADFSATATDAAGNTSPCSAPISYTRQHLDPGFGRQCVVPQLAGIMLKAAKKRIRAAGCTVGNVARPKPRKDAKRHRLIVRSSNPSPGTTLALGGKVNLRLAPKEGKAGR